MRLRRRRASILLALAMLGTGLGAIAGFWIGRIILFRAASASLTDYAQELTHHADDMSAELARVFHQPDRSQFAYCSPQELAELQAMTFRSRDIKDIGQTHSGFLDCSAFLGRLTPARAEGSPDLLLTDGTRVYTNVPVIMASSERGRATVIEFNDVNVVLSPDALDRWGRPQTRYMIVVTNPRTKRLAPIAGTNLSVDPEWVTSQSFSNFGGVLFSSHCSSINPICAVTSESLADIWGRSKTTQIAYAAMGGLAGFSLGLAFTLISLQANGLRRQLQQAIRRDSNSLSLVYQPIIEISSKRYIGAEALLRWKDREGVSIAPDVFIRLAEDAGFIGELTALVVRRTTRELGPLLRERPELSLSINVAASDINGWELSTVLEQCVRHAGIQSSQIILELTERSTAELGQISKSIQQLARIGYRVHIDDFGTGFSSLSYLDQLSVNAIKVDRTFTRTVGTDAVTASILPQILSMAESLHVNVVVEGVETQAQMQYLQSTEKEIQAQGWFFSRPMSAEALRIFLNENQPLAQTQASFLDAGTVQDQRPDLSIA